MAQNDFLNDFLNKTPTILEIIIRTDMWAHMKLESFDKGSEMTPGMGEESLPAIQTQRCGSPVSSVHGVYHLVLTQVICIN